MANSIVMDEEEFERASSGFSSASTDVATVGEGFPSSFSGALNAGLMNESVSSISNELASIAASIGSVKNIIAKHSNEMFTYDKTMSEMAEDIEIPTDFLANNAAQVNEYNRTLLGKIDGRSVNEGVASSEIEDNDESIVSAEGLKDITGETAKEEVYDDSSVIGNSILGSIVQGETEAQTYDDEVSVQKSALTDIGGNQTEEQAYDESTVVGKSLLGNINSNGASQEQAYDDSSSIAAAASLGDITSNSAGKAYDEVMIDTQNLASVAFANVVNSQDEKKKKVEEELESVNYDDFESHQ